MPIINVLDREEIESKLIQKDKYVLEEKEVSVFLTASCTLPVLGSEMYLFQEVEKPEMGYHEFIQLWTGRVPVAVGHKSYL